MSKEESAGPEVCMIASPLRSTGKENTGPEVCFVSSPPRRSGKEIAGAKGLSPITSLKRKRETEMQPDQEAKMRHHRKAWAEEFIGSLRAVNFACKIALKSP